MGKLSKHGKFVRFCAVEFTRDQVIRTRNRVAQHTDYSDVLKNKAAADAARMALIRKAAE